MAVHHNVVDIALALGEAAGNGRGARVVRAVVLARFGTGVDQEQARRIERGRRGETVQHFAVHRYDRGERNHAAARRGDAVERTGDGGFRHAGLHGHAHGGGVHLVTDGSGAVEFGDFLLALDVAQRHHGADELDTRRFAHLEGMQTGEVGHLDHDVVAIGRQVVHAATQAARFGEEGGQFAFRRGAFDAAFGGHVGH